ncbi:MAG TPA: TonB-dependent receptor [Gemmatimonadales bacterium]|jgi:hypothetical protein|nr:TonB-dependent receptor [Gemmatimonadales bacterium]
MTFFLVRLSARWGAAALALALLAPVRPAAAQGVTSGAIVGTITDDAGAGVPNAVLTLRNGSTGQRYSGQSRADGRFYFENVQVGGPYVLEARALGFTPNRSDPFTLRLGERSVQDLTLQRAAVELTGVTVEAEANPLLSPARTGAQSFVSESALARLPTLGRSFIDFVNTVPQVVSAGVPGASVGGQNNRFNNIQVDGGVNNDVFGLSASGTPGGQANAHPISVEAVKEFQVLIAPFDVRQGSFSGGLINAVTKSGTNLFRGSAFGYLQNEGLVGPDLGGRDATEFYQRQYGFTVSGPVIRDRVQFFVAADLQSRANPFGGQTIGADTSLGLDSANIGIRRTTAERVAQVLSTNPAYGFDPGTFTAPSIENPDRNFFGKVTTQLATNSQLELSYNYVKASSDVLIRNSTSAIGRDGYELSNSGYVQANVTNTARAKVMTQLSRGLANELLVGYNRIRDHREIPNRVPLIFVGGDRAGTNIAAGAERFSHDNLLNQDIVEITDNLTVPVGSKHLATVGVHNEFFHFVNGFFPASLGVWSFADTTALKNVTPNRYEIALPLRPGGPTADFHVKQWGFYAQDRWAPDPRLTVTLGLRVDIPVMDKPNSNPALVTALGVNTGDFPTGNAMWSPRVGFNYDVRGNGETRLRGGAGVFSGRPPYVWISNAFGNTGLEQATLTCTAAGTIPTFTIDVDAQPQVCAGGGAPTPPIPSIVYFEPDFKFPQNLKLALGLDHQLPAGIVGTFDFVYTKSINQFYITDVNLNGIVGFAAGEGGRPLYGTPTTNGSGVSRVSAGFRDVLRHRNEGQDRALQVTAELQKRFSEGVEFRAAYTYSHSEDLFSLGSSIASSNYRFTVLDGTLENRNLRTSIFDIPHKLQMTGIFGLPYGFNLSLVYIAQSGHPYTYVASTDANGDGFTGNDAIYVPRDRSDIALATPGDSTALFAFINSEACLRDNKGHILPRNSCRNGSINILNARFVKAIPTISGQSLELSLDIFNLLHLLNRDWGQFRETSGFENLNRLRMTTYDATFGRGVYALVPVQRDFPSQTASRWRVQLGGKYIF